MRICIPTKEGLGAASRVHEHFGDSPFFTIVDVEWGDAVAFSVLVKGRGRRDHHVRDLTRLGVNSVVCNRIRRNACAALRDAGIDVLSGVDGTVSGVLEAIKAGRTRAVEPGHACEGGRHRYRGHCVRGGVAAGRVGER